MAAWVRPEMRSAGCGCSVVEKALVALRWKARDDVRSGTRGGFGSGEGALGGVPTVVDRVCWERRESSKRKERRRVRTLPEEDEGRERSREPVARCRYAEACSWRCWWIRDVVYRSWVSSRSLKARESGRDTATEVGGCYV